jgi:DNA mismatch repair protein MutS2
MPIRREAQRTVGGIVHDTSATGATLFVEPPAAIEASNHIREMEIGAQREVDRLLLELTDLARPHAEEIAASFDALAELDSLHARARFADELRCGPVTLGEPAGDLVVRDGRHPLLLVQGVEVVPFDLTLSAGERTLLVSGPNTGGKTVLLKAVGLFQLLLQAGFPVPAAAETVLPCVDDVFADVGDEQSIEASLSTFSAHLRNLRDILARATAHSLVLIDELGSGTDPSEGAALGAAILEQLTARGVRTLATTHLGALKDLPLTVPGIINASLQFDDARLAPTFRFQQGIPGRSYGLQIAQRLGLPADVIARATARVPEQELAVSALLAELERRETELTQRETTLSADEARSYDHGRRVAERERAVRDREREVERAARAEARRYLLDARADVERTIAALRSAAGSDAERAEQERAARKALERSVAAHAEALADLDKPDSRIAMDSPVRVPVVGDAVETDSLPGRVGRLLERRDGDAVVAVGSLKLTVPMASVRRASVERADTVVIPLGEVPDVEVKTEIDLRGVRAADVDSLLLGSLDSAIRADLRSVRVIHGKGTGALRERVTEMLGKDVRVKSFRLGAWNEGGAGVTIVEFA